MALPKQPLEQIVRLNCPGTFDAHIEDEFDLAILIGDMISIGKDLKRRGLQYTKEDIQSIKDTYVDSELKAEVVSWIENNLTLIPNHGHN